MCFSMCIFIAYLLMLVHTVAWTDHMYRMHRNGISQKKNTKRDKISKKVVVKFFDDRKTATMKNLASWRVVVKQVEGGRL